MQLVSAPLPKIRSLNGGDNGYGVGSERRGRKGRSLVETSARNIGVAHLSFGMGGEHNLHIQIATARLIAVRVRLAPRGRETEGISTCISLSITLILSVTHERNRSATENVVKTI